MCALVALVLRAMVALSQDAAAAIGIIDASVAPKREFGVVWRGWSDPKLSITNLSQRAIDAAGDCDSKTLACVARICSWKYNRLY